MSTKKTVFMLSALFMIAFSSCQDDDKGSIIPSKSKYTLEAEGGELNIQINNDNWTIAGVVNKSGGDERIFGEIFSPDGQILRENALLELEGLGKLETSWIGKGFYISRSKPNELQITVEENLSGEEFSFGVILKNEDETKEIVVTQKISQGYTFDKIEYILQEGDKDSIYLKKGINRYISDLEKPGTKITIRPFDGPNNNSSYFEYDLNFILYWLDTKTINVQVPQYIYDGKIILSDYKHTFGEPTHTPYINNKEVTIELPAERASYYINLEWQLRKVTFVMTLTNNRTGDKKEVQGKWIENSLTGNYEIIKDKE